MGRPVFEPPQVPFVDSGLDAVVSSSGRLWRLAMPDGRPDIELAVASMGNPHALVRVPDVQTAPVSIDGPLVGAHERFPQGVNVGFMQVLDRTAVRLRVYERGAGETLACGTGACAAVALGIRLGWLERSVQVQAPGGRLRVQWPGDDAALLLSGPAVTVFSGDMALPDL